MKNGLFFVIAILGLLVSCDPDPMAGDDAYDFIGVYKVSVIEHVVWGASSGTLNDTGTLTITRIDKNRVQTNGYFRTQGEVVGNIVYFEAFIG